MEGILLDKRARRLRAIRWIANSFWVVMAVIALLNLLRWLLPFVSPATWTVLAAPFMIVFALMILPWFVVLNACLFGFVRCPRCQDRFSRWPSMWLSYFCDRCGHDIHAKT